jgi:hypothetical protein
MREPLPRLLADDPAGRAPLAASLPDGTPHPDLFLARLGWHARGGVYVRDSTGGHA